MNTDVRIQHLENPEFFEENCLPSVSDHRYYPTEEEALDNGTMVWEYSLNGSWKFLSVPNPQSVPNGYEKVAFSCVGWNEIQVPSQIELSGYGKPQYTDTDYPWDGKEQVTGHQIPKENNPTGCYVRYFKLSEELKKQHRIRLRFEGVETAFHCWINGIYIGYSEDSYTPATFDITEYVHDGMNKLAVEVYRFSSGSWLEDQDFWRMGGIIREVKLLAVPEIHIQDIEISADLNEDYTIGLLNTSVLITNESNRSCCLKWSLYDPSGILIEEKKEEVLGVEREQSCTIKYECPNVKTWSAEIPNLYKLVISISDENGNNIEAVAQNVGFRKFEIKDAIFYINGKKLLINGVNRHEYSARKGRAIGREEMEWDIRFLKQNNFNAVRTSHYPNQSYWYELCDLYGIYVMDETNLETHGTWQMRNFDFTLPGDKPEWKNACMSRAKAMLERDKNHPCIFSWSVGNESWSGQTLYEMSEYFRQRDPKRPVHYENVCHDRRWSATTDFESRMYARPYECEQYLKENPQKPYLLCEYSHAMGNSCGGLKKYVELFDKYPQYCGGFIWDYIDQSLYSKDPNGEEYLAYGGDFGDRATNYNFCTDGLLYGNRESSPKMQEVKFLYQPYRITPQEKEVVVESRTLFSKGEHFVLCWKTECEGRVLKSGSCSFEMEPGETKSFPCDFDVPKESGEYVLSASLVLAEDQMYAARGLEMCFGQTIVVRNGVKEKPLGKLDAPKVVEGDSTLGVYAENIALQFQKNTGKLSSYKIEGKEFVYDIANTLMPNFWRAPVDNDEGNRMKERCREWKIASLYPLLKQTQYQVPTKEKMDKFILSNTYNLLGGCSVDVEYQICGNGDMWVIESYSGAKNLPELPCYGMTWKLPKDICQIRWYGRGYAETYIDRKEGGRFGVHQSSSKNELSGYVIPQECGNHVDVRWVELTNKDGRGIRVEADQPFEFSAIPYTCHEMESARHIYELPKAYATVLRINQVQMGVGGDNSWGACPHDEYRIDSSKDRVFKFKIIPL